MSGFECIATAGGAPIKAWTRDVPVEATARQQIENVARLPFIHSHVAVMPDVHWGMGATVGSVIPTVRAIVPAAVGVDIGCGMAALRTNVGAAELPDSLAPLRAAIEAAVPHGRSHNGGPEDVGTWRDAVPAASAAAWGEIAEGYARILEQHPKARHPRPAEHLGTLGTGNHFVELCLDEADRLWVMLHSGSRGVGNRLGTTFIELALTARRSAKFRCLPGARLSGEAIDFIRSGSHTFCAPKGGAQMVRRPEEKPVQIRVSAELKKAIHRTALERDETVRTFILKALKQRGIAVSDADLVDRRKATSR